MTLRILDVGAHDGYVSAYALKTFPDAHIDAIELHEDFARQCDQRITGTCKVGRAEDAPTLFEPGTYDAVMAFEILEHVTDMPAFLDACEQMLVPGGQVYLSTPDGCFGEGANPHHLRALRAIDVADMLRRRGRLQDMAVGSDTVTNVRYTPGPRTEDIAIWCGPGWEPWHPLDIHTRGLGGSETAAVRLAEALSAMGPIVTVYGEMREDTTYKDVIFRHHSKFDPLDSRDVLISSRDPSIFDRPTSAGVRMLWVHDIDCGDQLTPRRAEAIDHILGLSRFHVAHLKGRYPFARDKIRQSRNGLDLSLFQPLPWEDRDPTILVTSSPDRGLDIMLEEFPRIRVEVPDARLVHCYAQVYDVVADKDPDVGRHRTRIRELAQQPGVTSVGSLSQPDLAKLMCRSRVWAHPSWNTIAGQAFQETSCIGAMEAQAAGCLVVASNWGALPDTVKVGRRVNSDPPNARWRNAIVAECIDGLTSPETGAWAGRKGPAAMQDHGWDGVAVQVAELMRAETSVLTSTM